MRWLLATVIAFTLWTIPAQAVQFDYAIEHSLPCGMTAHGVFVRVYNRKCPDMKWMTEMNRRFLSRMSAGSNAIWGSTAVMVGGALHTWENGAENRVFGVNPNKHYVVFSDEQDLWDTYGHEMGHLLLRRHDFYVNDLHYAYKKCGRDKPNKDMEACELLPAATAWYTSIPLLSKNSRFRKAFEN